MKSLIIILVFLRFSAHAQDVFNGCPLGGDKAKTAHLDSLKNRYVIPAKYHAVSWDYVSSMKIGNDNIDPVQLSGYVSLVKDGGKETANCHSATDKDIHIEIAKDENHTHNKDCIVVEITPRIQAIMKRQGLDYSLHGIKTTFLHHYVTVYGYLFSDEEHKQNSVVDNPGGTDIWRITCEELHPVTFIKMIK